MKTSSSHSTIENQAMNDVEMCLVCMVILFSTNSLVERFENPILVSGLQENYLTLLISYLKNKFGAEKSSKYLARFITVISGVEEKRLT